MSYCSKMDVDDIPFLSALEGKRLKLTLKNASYFGTVQRVNTNKTIILVDVVGATNGFRYPGSKLFFGHDIVNVEFTSEEKEDSSLVHRSIQEKKPEDHLTVERFQPYRSAFGRDDDDDGEENISFVVIDQFREKFGHAVMHIKKQHIIGLGADGLEIYKHGRLCWLQIATKHNVYLFDILLLGAHAFKNGLAMILESKHILKVIHDCRAIAGCLTAQFGVNLTNVFDTQVADVMCFYSETGGLLPDRVSTLQEVISLYLKVPSSQLLSLQMKSQLSKEEDKMWYKHPCPLPLLKVMALSVIHLLPLRLVLLDTLMADYLLLVDSYLQSSLYQPDDLEHLSMDSLLELPKELRQLEQKRCNRQEWATERFPVTEQGLLDRFNPRTCKGSAAGEEQRHDQEAPANFEPESTETSSVNASASPCVGRERTEPLMDTNIRGVSPGKSSFTLLPGIGRGFLLQPLSAQIPGETSKKEASVAPQSLSQSFRLFRD